MLMRKTERLHIGFGQKRSGSGFENTYVATLERTTQRPKLPWTFRTVDTLTGTCRLETSRL